MAPSPRRPTASERLQRTRERHAALQRRRLAATSSAASIASLSIDDVDAVDANNNADQRPQQRQQPESAVAAVEALAEQLHGLSKSEMLVALHKVGSSEKDALITHLMARVATLETQRNDVAALGERIAAQLVQQQVRFAVGFTIVVTCAGGVLISLSLQHELQREHDATVAQLQEQVRSHPELRRLEDTVATLQDAQRETERQLQLAVQRLHRSRKRERELRQQQDPLWDI
ncbi:hypothetical protein PINS_up004752 [Pythium insidiosum]|nr:hypothetical protein PINS_up004752 [Pythium insidiosum]